MTVEQIRAEYEASGGRDAHVEGRFAVVNCSFRDGKRGRFATVELRDGTGTFTARCFEEALLAQIDSAGAVDARLRVSEFNGAMSAIMLAWDRADLDGDDVLRLAGLDPEAHARRVEVLEGWLTECDASPWGSILRALFADAASWHAFCRAPAAVRLHHAEPGGLVRHLVEVGTAGLALLDSSACPYDRHYFLAGVFLHDIGKLDTYTLPPTIAYTAQGQMGEHQVWSTFRLGKACVRAGASASIESRLVHIIEQAHGAYRHAEWQDPVGIEAKALATADYFSSRLGVTEKERRAQDLLDRLLAGDADEPDRSDHERSTGDGPALVALEGGAGGPGASAVDPRPLATASGRSLF